MASIKSVKTRDFRKALVVLGLEHKGTNGSHERWSKKGMWRPVIFPNNKKEQKEVIVKSNLKTLDMTWEEFEEILDSL